MDDRVRPHSLSPLAVTRLAPFRPPVRFIEDRSDDIERRHVCISSLDSGAALRIGARILVSAALRSAGSSARKAATVAALDCRDMWS